MDSANPNDLTRRDPSTTGGRLPTFKVPRNLTLSASGPSGVPAAGPVRTRQVFVPNIPPRRVAVASAAPAPAPQNSDSSDSHSQSSNKSFRNRKNERQDRQNRKFKGSKDKPALVQSSSIFGEGIAAGDKGSGGAGSRRFGASGAGGAAGANRSASTSTICRANLKEIGDSSSSSGNGLKITNFLDDLNRAGNQEDLDYDGDRDWSLEPVSLPLANYLKKEPKITIPGAVATMPGDTKIKIKIEPGCTYQPLVPARSTLAPAPVFSSFAQTLNLKTPESPESPEILFLQLPDLLPLTTITNTRDSNDNHSKSFTSSTGIGAARFPTLPDGCIGKIQVLASGRTRLVIGDNWFDISGSKEAAFQQEFVTIDPQFGTLSLLGQMNQKFLCTANLENLLN